MLAPPQSIKRALSAQETALASALSFAPHLLANRAHVAWVWASGGRSAIMLADSRLVIRELAGPVPMSHTSLCFWLLPSAERAMPFFGASLVLVRKRRSACRAHCGRHSNAERVNAHGVALSCKAEASIVGHIGPMPVWVTGWASVHAGRRCPRGLASMSIVMCIGLMLLRLAQRLG